MMPPPPPNSLTVWFVSISFRRRMTFSKDELFAYANWSPKLKGFFRRNFTAAAATPRDDVMLYAKSVQRWKPPMIFSFWGRKHFSKSSKILEVTLRIVWWNPLALAKEDEHRCCSTSINVQNHSLFGTSSKVPSGSFLYYFSTFEFSRQNFLGTGYEWLSIFGKTSFPARLKINLFRRLHHSAAFYFLQANQIVECQSIKSVGVAEFSIFLCLFPRDEKTLSLRPRTSRASFSRVLL